jgi:hypothetical protein
MSRASRIALRLTLAAAIAVSSYIHAELYVAHGYRHIHVVGPAFLLQASGGFAIASLLVVTGTPLIRLGALGVMLGAVGGFLASRTVGVFGFIEHGFTPAPEAAISLVAEVAGLLLLAAWQWRILANARARPTTASDGTALVLAATTRPSLLRRHNRPSDVQKPVKTESS